MSHSCHPIVAPIECLERFVDSVELHRLFRVSLELPAAHLFGVASGKFHHMASIEWCKVFGSREQNTHWTRAIPSALHAQVRSEIHSLFAGGNEEWTAYRESIVSQRDQMAAHHDLDAGLTKWPRFDDGIDVAEVVHRHLYAALDDGARGGVVASLRDYRQARQRQFALGLRHALSGRAQVA